MKKRFHKVNVEISNICNLQCSFCPEVKRKKQVMSVELFEKVAQQISGLTDLVCLHLMGDPLVHPNLQQLIDICKKHQLPIFLVTNAVLLNTKNVELLLDPQFYQVNFSLHSYPDNYPDKNPDAYLNKIFAYTSRALKERPELYINYRLWNLDAPNGKNHNNIYMLKKIEEYFAWQAPQHVDVRLSKGIKIQGRLYSHFDTEFTWPSMDLPLIGEAGTCYGLRNHFGVLADGTVVPCCLDSQGVIPLGNVEEASIEEILSGERATQMLQGFRQRKLVEDLCKRCNYIERF